MKKRILLILIIFPLILMVLLGMSLPIFANNVVPEYATKTDLIVYKTTDVGDVWVWNDSDIIYVQYETTGNWYLTEMHVDVSQDWTLIPQTINFNPIPGLFDAHQYFNLTDNCQSYRFEIEIPEDIDHGDLIAIAAHAKVSTIKLKKSSSSIVTESAWGAGTSFNVNKNWGMWFEHMMNRPPVAEISYSPEEPGWCDLVTVSGTSSYDPDDDILSFQWDLDYDGITFYNDFTGESFQQNFAPGEYLIALKVIDSYGAFSIDVETISVINHAPVAEFHAGNDCIAYWQQPFRFFNDSSDADTCDFLIYVWDFGDGNTNTSTDFDDYVDHTYAEPGTYTVSLTATDLWGGQNVISHDVLVYNSSPIASFSVMNDNLHFLEQPFQFVNMSTDPDEIGDPNLTYDWDFGDGTSSTEKNPTHEYFTIGDYTVALSVTDTWGGTDTTSQLVSVYNTAPIAGFNVGSDYISYSQQPFAFFNLSYDWDALDNLMFLWDFGDGQTEETSSTAMLTHSYTNLGTYTVSLTVTDAYGDYDTSLHDVTVYNNLPDAEFHVAGGFTVSLSNQPTQFIDDSTDPDYSFDPVLTYSWNFGDGGTSTDQNPTHTYSETGTYLVVLTVTDIWNDSSVKLHWIDIVE